MLGKRKRDHTAVPRQSLGEINDNEVTNVDASDLFRQYFEAQFEPLPQEPSATHASSTDEDEAEGDSQSETSQWSGFTESDTIVGDIRVVEHTVVPRVPAEARASEGKYFMSSKPPRFGKPILTQKVAVRPAEADEDVTDAANLKKDLELQRLLKESHLLERPSLAAAPSINRDKVTDLRMQALGAKTSLFTQRKMPMAHRRGIKAKALMRDEARRKEAQENGIVLEKASKGKPNGTVKRDRAIGTPAVGTFVGGTLKLSRKDIREINGPRPVATGKRKGKRWR